MESKSRLPKAVAVICHYMGHFGLIMIFLCFGKMLPAQSGMEKRCDKEIRSNSRNRVFPKYKGAVVVSKDTIHFGSSAVTLHDSKPEKIIIFKQGLLFPDLILGASTNGDGKFSMNTLPYSGTISIGSLEEINIPENGPKLKTFSFLVWRNGMANPSLYMFELTNEKADSKTENDLFIRHARLTALGFCSILI